jgi:hypothetical protein
MEEGNSLVTTYVDKTASVAAKSTVKTKFSASNTLLRGVAQRNEALPIVDGSLKLSTWNISLACHPEHDPVVLKRNGMQLANAATKPEFWDNLIRQMS